MAEAYIIDAVRTPVGRRGGGLAAEHPADMGAHVLNALVDRTGIDPITVEDVVFGCLDTIGSQAGDVARTCWLAAGLSDEVPGTTVDRQCGSSQQAVHFAAQAILSGTMDVVIAGGVQTMTQIPISSAMTAAIPMGFNDPFTGSAGWVARYGNVPPTQFKSAQMIADRWELTREDLEVFSLESHNRALAAIREGRLSKRDQVIIASAGCDCNNFILQLVFAAKEEPTIVTCGVLVDGEQGLGDNAVAERELEEVLAVGGRAMKDDFAKFRATVGTGVLE
jgi:acetyl-CoA C-acetyltransferase